MSLRHLGWALLGVLFLLGMGWFVAREQEACEQARERAARMLSTRVARFQAAEIPEKALHRLVRAWARNGKASFQGFLSAMEKHYPGAIRVVAWNVRGEIVPLHGPVLSGKRMWERLARRFFLPATSPRVTDEQIATDADLKSLRSFLGKRAPLPDILALRNSATVLTWLDKSCLLFRYAAPLSVQKGGGEIAGAMVMVFPQHLPRDFWRFVTLQNGVPELKDGDTPAVMMNLENPRRNFSQPGAPRGRAFFRELRRSYRIHPSPVFSCGRHLMTEVPATEEVTRRVFLSWNMGPFEEAAETRVLLFSLAFGASLFVLGSRANQLLERSTAVFSFRFRLVALFLVALSLPFAVFFLMGGATLAAEEEKMKNGEIEHLKLISSQLNSQFMRFYEDFGDALVWRMDRLMRKVSSQRAFIPHLTRMVEKKRISSFYLATLHGTLKHFLDPRHGLAGNPRMKALVRESFTGVKAFAEKIPVSGNAHQLLVPGEFLRLFLMEERIYVFSMVVSFAGERLILVIEVRSELLEKRFAELMIGELRRGKNDWPGTLEFFSPFQTVPRKARVCEGLRDSGWLGEAMTGAVQTEVSVAGVPMICFLDESAELAHFRPLAAVSLEAIQAIRRRRRQRLLVVGVVALLPAALLGLVLSTSLTRPIRDLDAAVNRIREGDLTICLPVFGENEFSALNRLFNEMTQGLQERERMRGFVSGAVLRAVRDEEVGISLRGEAREVTILFSHLKEFPAWSQSIPPTDLFFLLNEFLAGSEACIRAFGGEVDKFLGDAIMAVFPQKGHETAAIQAAEALTDFVRQFNDEAANRGTHPIRIGIGINTGNVIMGDVGSKFRKDLTVIGDAVNVAARLESVSDLGCRTHILLSGTTFDRTRDSLMAGLLPISHLKGKQEEVRVYEFESWRGRPS